MSERGASGEEGLGAPTGFARRRRLALAVGGTLAAILAGVWLDGRPIATRLIDRTLAERRVPARYRLADLGPGEQRLTDIAIGDPAHPDLVADWIETRIGWGWSGPTLTGVRAGRVRVHGRLIDGRLSFGAIDRLAGGNGGTSAGLPAIDLAVADARLRLDTPAGTIGAKLIGSGRLDDGFVGRAAVVARGLVSGGCVVAAPRAVWGIATRRGTVRLTGPVDAAGATCGRTRLARPAADVDVALTVADPAWRGTMRIGAAGLVDPRGSSGPVAGQLTIDGGRGATRGTLALTADRVAAAGMTVARVGVTGPFALGAASRLDATLTASGARAGAATLASLRGLAARAAGSPVGPLVEHALGASAGAAAGFGGTAGLVLTRGDGAATLELTRAALVAATGATLRYQGSLVVGRPAPAEAAIAIEGGGLPTADLSLRSAAAGTGAGAIEGAMVVAPYAAGGASLTIAPVALRGGPAGWRAQTTATLSGPLADGRVERLTMPVGLRRSADGTWLIGERCTPLAVERLTVGGLRLDPMRLTLCPPAAALVRIAATGAVSGGATLGPTRLTGRLGDAPLAVESGGAGLSLADRGFVLRRVVATLGAPGRATRLDAAELAGSVGAGGVAGRFAGAGGRIGSVPLLLSQAGGTWRVAGGALAVEGALTVTDADAPAGACAAGAAGATPRFCPMQVRDVALRLADDRIVATGILAEPRTGTRVATLRLTHDLAGDAGQADLTVAGLSFKPGFQPNQLTPLAEGVVANVAGTIDGRGHIAWNDAPGDRGVTSTGHFTTAATDLAAAFGPVTGIAGTITFTDLLGLATAPDQRLTVRSINPGIPVENGVVGYRLDPGGVIVVDSARWPFAGGTLTLDPTRLDFSSPAERHLTFHVAGVAADRFLQQFDYKNLSATGTFDGVLPMVFDDKGGRIAGGELTVRQGGGGIAYVGDLTEKDLGFWGNFAFQALKSLRYRSLGITLNGPLEGEMVTEVRFAGVSQGAGAKSNFLIRRLQRLPFVFNIRIKAPFRELLNTTSSFSDPTDLLHRSLPGLLSPIQPEASPAVPDTKRP